MPTTNRVHRPVVELDFSSSRPAKPSRMPILHVVIPVYNERETLDPCIRRVLAVTLPESWTLRLWLIDDHSDEANYRVVKEVFEAFELEGAPITLSRHEVNQGKGAALQTGFDRILESGAPDEDLVIIQDADLEYDPDDFPTLMEPLLTGEKDAVLGTRWGEPLTGTGLKRRIHAWGNGLLTKLSNVMTGYRVSDMECCYKVLSVGVLRRLRPMMSEQRFGIEPQLVASLSRIGARVAEVPIRYDPRGLSAGKKIGWKDGVRAIWVILRERLRSTPAVSLADSTPDAADARPTKPTDA